MITMLTIGHMRMLLRSQRGLATIIDVLSKADLVDEVEYGRGTGKPSSITTKGRPEISVVTLPHLAFKARRSPLEADEILPPQRALPEIAQPALTTGRPMAFPAAPRQIAGRS